jgi:hypothetical protein
MTALRVELSWPAAELSPNARVHHFILARFKKAAKTEAGWATKLALQSNRHWAPPEDKIPVHLIAHPPEAWRTGDADNFIARCKAHLDAIAKAVGVNDRKFSAPTVEWADRQGRGKLIVLISSAEMVAR